MNERDTMPNYRVDNSKELLANEEIVKKDDEVRASSEYKSNSLSKTKIININDFIFRQYLEFYPDLQGLSCKDNILYLKKDGEIVASEALTFDLRTLPGEAWNVNAKKFMEIIKLNKNCKKLEEFIQLLNEDDSARIAEGYKDEILENRITNYMNLYFDAKEEFQYLMDDNKALMSRTDFTTANPKNKRASEIVNQKLDEYLDITKKIGDTKGLKTVTETKENNLALVRKKEEPVVRSSKAAFVNIAIIIYGVVNIGIILAIALMK